MTLRPNRWDAVERLYHAALAQPVDGRSTFLAEACRGDEELRREVESLLAQPVSAAFKHAAVLAAAEMVTPAGTHTLTGNRIGPYQILEPIGAGGMGEVYRARDTRLGREVAIKIVPQAFTADADRLARFEREARVLASLNHQHIAAIHGLEDAHTEAGTHVRALVLELVEGETLAERLARARSKGLPIKEALDIARQIADALDAAHEKGIVHRDLKPANIKITPQGIVKVLDFGLAKLDARSVEIAEGVTAAPTITVNDTREGLIVGTAAYMSPEQARGQPVDKRTDVWSFGCVVYEMLVGNAPFKGATVSDTIAAVLEHEPDWSALPSALPSSVTRLLRRSLEQDPKRRLRDVGDARMDLFDEADAVVRTSGSLAQGRRSRARTAAWIIAVLGAVAALAILVRQPTGREERTVRLSVVLPDGMTFDGRGLAIAPNGRQLVVAARNNSGARILWIRSLDSAEGRELPGSQGAMWPFWSPDSSFIAFFAEGKLKKLPVNGGPAQTLGDAADPRGGTWNRDGTIVFDPNALGALYRIPASGGAATPATTRPGGSKRFPHFLPDGRRFLFLNLGAESGGEAIRVGSLDDQESERVLSIFEEAVYADPGYLLFKRGPDLMAQRFDSTSLKTSGEPIPVANQLLVGPLRGTGNFSVSETGDLAFAGAATPLSQLTWLDRGGKEVISIGEPGNYLDPQLSPDETRVAFELNDVTTQVPSIWLLDLKRQTPTRLTFSQTCGIL